MDGGVGFCTPRFLLESLDQAEEEADLLDEIFEDEIDNDDEGGGGPFPIDPRGGVPVSFGVSQDREGPEQVAGEETHQNIVLDGRSISVDQEALVADLASTPATVTASGLPLALAFTAFGEACSDRCEDRGDLGYTWCHKSQESGVGTWRDADYCSTSPRVTSHGEQCVDACETRGYDYYWCHKDSTLWGYCTPEHLIIK